MEGFSEADVPEGFAFFTGMGLRGTVEGREILIGNPRLMEKIPVASRPLEEIAANLRKSGKGAMLVAVDRKPAAMLAVKNPVKETTKAAPRYFQRKGIEVIMLTGDNRLTAAAIAAEVGIDQFKGDVLPERKDKIVRELRAKKKFVAIVGNGISDAPALAQANVGTAMGTGTDEAMESALVTLVKGDLLGIVRAHRLSHETMKNIRQNLFFAFFYNVLRVPMAAGVLYPLFGLALKPDAS